MPGTTQKAGEWAVWDTNAYQPKEGAVGTVARPHEVKPGVIYHLHADEACYMPEAHARVFLKDGAFKVQNEEGEEVTPLLPNALVRTAPVVLPIDQVIAGLHELTIAALVTRAGIRPGGDRFNNGSTRQELIDFLVGEGDEDEQPTRGRQRRIGRDEPDVQIDADEEMSEDQLQRMLDR